MSYLVRSLGGDTLATIITLSLVAAIFNALLAALVEWARVLYTSGRDCAWPAPVSRALAYLHPTTRTPIVATLALGAAVGVLTAITDQAAAVTFTSVILVATFALIAVSALVSRLRQTNTVRPYCMPLWPLPPVVALAGVALTAWLQTGKDLVIVGGLGLAGALYYAAYLRPRRDTHWRILDPAPTADDDA
jgi:amino acid transporter